jgi:hypothetical protein
MSWFRSNKSDPVKRSASQQLKLPEITSSSASGLGVISPAQGVFMLAMSKGEVIVLKSENYSADGGNRQGYDSANKVMARVSKIRAVSLTESEIKAVNGFKTNAAGFENARNEVKAGKRFWIKAAYVVDEGNLEAPDATKDFTQPVSQADQAKRLATITKICQGLGNNTKAWRQLGKIAAADMFNGNADRFNFDFKPWVQNWGNIMFSMANGEMNAMGLDNYASNQRKAGRTDLILTDRWESAHGEFIKDTKKGEASIENIFSEMKTSMESYGLTPRFGAPELDSFKSGFVSGVKSIKNYVTGPGSAIRGEDKEIKKKLDFLGWGMTRTVHNAVDKAMNKIAKRV